MVFLFALRLYIVSFVTVPFVLSSIFFEQYFRILSIFQQSLLIFSEMARFRFLLRFVLKYRHRACVHYYSHSSYIYMANWQLIERNKNEPPRVILTDVMSSPFSYISSSTSTTFLQD